MCLTKIPANTFSFDRYCICISRYMWRFESLQYVIFLGIKISIDENVLSSLNQIVLTYSGCWTTLVDIFSQNYIFSSFILCGGRELLISTVYNKSFSQTQEWEPRCNLKSTIDDESDIWHIWVKLTNMCTNVVHKIYVRHKTILKTHFIW